MLEQEKFEKIRNDIQKILTEKRYNHSIGVAKKAEELAKKYNQNVQNAKLVGIAHDIAKQMEKEVAYEYANKHNIQFDEIEKNEPALVHSKIGASICKEKYNFTNEMAQAIMYHTTGHVKMTTFDKIIFLADKIEENRTNEDVEEIRKIAEENLDEAILYALRRSIKYTIDKKRLVHPDSINLMNKIIIEKYI